MEGLRLPNYVVFLQISLSERILPLGVLAKGYFAAFWHSMLYLKQCAILKAIVCTRALSGYQRRDRSHLPNSGYKRSSDALPWLLSGLVRTK